MSSRIQVHRPLQTYCSQRSTLFSKSVLNSKSGPAHYTSPVRFHNMKQGRSIHRKVLLSIGALYLFHYWQGPDHPIPTKRSSIHLAKIASISSWSWGRKHLSGYTSLKAAPTHKCAKYVKERGLSFLLSCTTNLEQGRRRRRLVHFTAGGSPVTTTVNVAAKKNAIANPSHANEGGCKQQSGPKAHSTDLCKCNSIRREMLLTATSRLRPQAPLEQSTTTAGLQVRRELGTWGFLQSRSRNRIRSSCEQRWWLIMNL